MDGDDPGHDKGSLPPALKPALKPGRAAAAEVPALSPSLACGFLRSVCAALCIVLPAGLPHSGWLDCPSVVGAGTHLGLCGGAPCMADGAWRAGVLAGGSGRSCRSRPQEAVRREGQPQHRGLARPAGAAARRRARGRQARLLVQRRPRARRARPPQRSRPAVGPGRARWRSPWAPCLLRWHRRCDSKLFALPAAGVRQGADLLAGVRPQRLLLQGAVPRGALLRATAGRRTTCCPQPRRRLLLPLLCAQLWTPLTPLRPLHQPRPPQPSAR